MKVKLNIFLIYLTYILPANFGFMLHTIKQLETRKISWSESICGKEVAQNKFEKAQGHKIRKMCIKCIQEVMHEKYENQ